MKRILTVPLLSATLALSGCAVVSISNDNQQAQFKTTAKISAPAWPWQDTASTLSRLNVSAGTNRFTGSLKDVSQETSTSTNAVNLIQAVVEAAVKAAVGVAAK